MVRLRVRTRVALLTGAYAVALVAVTLFLGWRAIVTQDRWSGLTEEEKVVRALDGVMRQNNEFLMKALSEGHFAPDRYERLVMQLLENVPETDTGVLRQRMAAVVDDLRELQGEAPSSVAATSADLAVDARRVSWEASRLVRQRSDEIDRHVELIKRDTRLMMISAIAIAWIFVVVSIPAAKTFRRKVVAPLEELATVAERIAQNDVKARVTIAGDRELARLGEALNHMAEELTSRARTDDLTQLPNFRAFSEKIEEVIQHAARFNETFGILVLDLDRFKSYNDRFGHLAGNEALQRVSHAIREAVRVVDHPARYGGEEFAVIVPQVDAESLRAVGERIRAGVEAVPAPADGDIVTVSIGAAIYPLDGTTPGELFHSADTRLYQAKEEGRNRVIVPSPVRAVHSAG